MYTRKSLAALALFGLFATAACEGDGIAGMNRSQTVGTGAGAVVGGAAGYLITGGPIGTIVGMAAGGVLGNRLGNFLDKDAHQTAAEAAARAAEVATGQRVTWQKTDPLFRVTHTGFATPTANPHTDAQGRTCRRIQASVTQNSQTQTDNIVLCRAPNGWVAA